MSGLRITGSGRYLPGRPYTNHDLSRVMDTSDAWIRQRTGIVQRHFAAEGQGASDLALHASRAALADAGLEAADLDYILFNTMTPDHIFPGSGPLLSFKLGCPQIPALDVRAQCAAMVYGLQLADSLLQSGHARRILLVGAECHAGFMPWRDWGVLEGERNATPEDFARATAHRSLAVIFGDGAGALVLDRQGAAGTGLLAVQLHSDGKYVDDLLLEPGFTRRPFLDAAMIQEGRHVPSMNGREVFRQAVSRLPKVVRDVCDRAGVTLNDVDWFVAHQANDRINHAVRERLGVPAEKVPSNIARYGNTSSATIPILIDEMREQGSLKPGQLVCVLALGAGIHWGAALYRL